MFLTPRNIVDVSARTLMTAWRYVWRFGLALVAIAGLYEVVQRFWLPPSVDLAWVNGGPSGPIVSEFGRDEFVAVGVEDLYRHRIRLPLQLALRNRELLPLNGLTVQLFYARVLVQSGARQLASSDSAVIWEHSLGTLAPGTSFKPITDVDQVFIPMDSLLMGAFTVTSAGYPEYIEFFRERRSPMDTSRVTLGIGARLTADGRARSSEVLMTVPIWIDERAWWPPRIPYRESPANRADSLLFLRAFAGEGDTLFGGSFRTPHYGRLRYACIKTRLGRLLGYSIDGKPMRVLADTSNGWLVDLDLVMLPNSGGHLVRRTYFAPRPMDVPGVPTSMRPPIRGEVSLGPSVMHWTLRQ